MRLRRYLLETRRGPMSIESHFVMRSHERAPTTQNKTGPGCVVPILSSVIVFLCQTVSAEPYSHFGLCVAPSPPSCARAALKSKKQRDQCIKITNQYVSLVFAYRVCLSSEMERAVREANETLRVLKCQERKGSCLIPAQLEPFERKPSASYPGSD